MKLTAAIITAIISYRLINRQPDQLTPPPCDHRRTPTRDLRWLAWEPE